MQEAAEVVEGVARDARRRHLLGTRAKSPMHQTKATDVPRQRNLEKIVAGVTKWLGINVNPPSWTNQSLLVQAVAGPDTARRIEARAAVAAQPLLTRWQ